MPSEEDALRQGGMIPTRAQEEAFEAADAQAAAGIEKAKEEMEATRRELFPIPEDPGFRGGPVDPVELDEEALAALERLKGKAERTMTEIMEDLIGEAGPALDVDPIPEIAHSQNFKKALQSTLVYGERLLKEQGAYAIRNLRQVSEEAAKEGILILEQLAELGLHVANAEISADGAKQVTENLFEALHLVALRVEVEAQKEAYLRGQAALKALRSVLFALLEIGVSSAVPQAGPLLAALTSNLDSGV